MNEGRGVIRSVRLGRDFWDVTPAQVYSGNTRQIWEGLLRISMIFLEISNQLQILKGLE